VIGAYAPLLGITEGWMFRDKKEAPSRTSDYEALFFEVIQWSQERGDLSDNVVIKDDDVIAVFGSGRSGRRGYSTHATKMGISDAAIKRLARWRSIEAIGGKAPSFAGGTKESYQEINLTMTTLLRASEML
jgi:hypothetical protein